MKYLLLIIFAYSLNGVALLILAFRVGRPWHAALSLAVWGISWIPLIIAGWLAGEEVLNNNSTMQSLVSVYWPYLLLLLVLIAIGYVARRHYRKRNNDQGTK